MLKKLGVVFVVVIFGLFLLETGQGQAQEAEIIQVKSEAIELFADTMYIPCEDPLNPICEPYPENTAHPDPANPDHELKIANEEFEPNTEVYIAGCINTGSGIHCTTGDEQLDEKLNNIPGGDMMTPDPSYQFKALTNPVRTDESGNLEVIVRSFSPQVTSHIFNAYYVTDQDVSPTTITVDPSVSPEESLHLQSFERTTTTPTPATIRRPRRNRPKGQRFIDWDPKGRTFDIRSLEPITGVEVTLLDNFKNLFSYKKIINPQIVQANGEFNFWVPNGIYYLQFAKLPETHTWPVTMDKVHPNYSLAYYCDPEVKDSENLPVSLYYNQFSIIEFNKLVHCDVPLDPGNNTPIRTPVKIIDFGLNRNTADGSLTYSGKVSHPFTKVQLMAQSTERIVQEVEADKLGFWRTTLLTGLYPLTAKGVPDKIVLRYIKKDLTASQVFEPIGGITFEPLLNYIEGYAYDPEGKIIPEARVGIKQENSDKVIYLATADKGGYFKIGSQYLPSLPYDLVFSNPKNNTNEIVASSQFLAGNQEYLQSKQLNLISADNRAVPLATVAVSSFKALRTGQNQNLNSSGEPIDEQSEETSSIFSPALLITLFLVVVAGGLLIYTFAKNKKTSSTTPSL
ncbi:hypothetical protein A2313_01875 [Candidatus Roizmanbacteria bacterium RIFOXYB2_FULL_41_10]|uniref:Uncharacterized protein n=1 Tax=Candidatus Roizmanbacteria bacterium RIFOXYA1_FULL_41_12 TaxID=1802082 RepID=A0A1F7KA29_9BACT|nr:MAG: hypothetical protein A2209_00125 [Candidatus Roizmanbacteria bacterium RIFOXYA1_FULL_41_12]OGK66681.1 MAG: hypothetical protein A2262_03520 [Candidatus Roizmanbacteria bacterium RIFOXYA2_FULL_41_8]OGK67537.1 MAG: hypothetical protein A2377_01680 [Candidatus Roizmanbacteria bacterium RIFOXYB1_FULL_41_27]OGK70943.1 MAG: hypothetical protein A2313_01875 [Candidatus Roizmanbacteria bacterium RIFOXYB2_FULL_41_10]OGK71193.1 MAG: hypothetical protein A2403_00410 [Candidatus Roizmanbacteria bac